MSTSNLFFRSGQRNITMNSGTVQISKFLSVSTKEFITVFANLGYIYYCGNQKSEYYMFYILSF